MIISRMWDSNFLHVISKPCFIQKTENTLLKLRLTMAASAFLGQWWRARVHPCKWEVTPAKFSSPGWTSGWGQTYIVGPFDYKVCQGLCGLMTEWRGQEIRIPALCGGPTQTHRCVCRAGRPGLPSEGPARWPWVVPCGLPLCDEEW